MTARSARRGGTFVAVLLFAASACGPAPVAEPAPAGVGADVRSGASGAPPRFLGPFLAVTAADGWRLRTMGGRALPAGPFITLFPGRGSLGGFGGCNAYGARVEPREGGGLSLSAVEMTEVACLDPSIGDREASYLAVLGGVTEARLDGERLVLEGAEGVLVYDPIPPPRGSIDDVVGGAWRISVLRPSEAGRFTMALPGAGVAFGRAACRAWVADYRSRMSAVAFTTISMVGEPCADEGPPAGAFGDVLTWARDVVAFEHGWTLRTVRGDEVEFQRTPPASVEGSWSLLGLRSERGPVEEPTPDPAPTLVVGPSSLQGDGGCNTFQAEWSGDRDRPDVRSVVRGERPCVRMSVLQREETLVRLLSGARVMRAMGDLLWIGLPDGAGLLFERVG